MDAVRRILASMRPIRIGGGVGGIRIPAKVPEVRPVISGDLRGMGRVGVVGAVRTVPASERAIRVVDAVSRVGAPATPVRIGRRVGVILVGT